MSWRRLELAALCVYALGFYLVVIRKSLRLSHDYSGRLYGLRAGSLSGHLNDLSDAQWRNFGGNLPVLTIVMGAFLMLANTLRYCYSLKGRGASMVWLLLSLSYLFYLHGACVSFILLIALINYSIVKKTGDYSTGAYDIKHIKDKKHSTHQLKKRHCDNRHARSMDFLSRHSRKTKTLCWQISFGMNFWLMCR